MTSGVTPASDGTGGDPAVSHLQGEKEVVIGDALAQAAIVLAEELLRAAKVQQTAQEHSQAQKIARMMEDPHGKDLTIALADQAFRSHQPARIADQLRHLLQNYGDLEKRQNLS